MAAQGADDPALNPKRIKIEGTEFDVPQSYELVKVLGSGAAGCFLWPVVPPEAFMLVSHTW